MCWNIPPPKESLQKPCATGNLLGKWWLVVVGLCFSVSDMFWHGFCFLLFGLFFFLTSVFPSFHLFVFVSSSLPLSFLFRSHSIFTLNVHVKERDGNNRLTGSTRIGRLNLVDLSGSENRKRAGGPGVGVRVPLTCCNLKVF